MSISCSLFILYMTQFPLQVFQVLLTDADNTQYREFFDQAIVPEVDMDYYSKMDECDITTLGISLDLNRVAFTKVLNLMLLTP